jgi:NAD(P)-dependent dehydrogenase (short-subunit alcohol dehydrogenase family)
MRSRTVVLITGCSSGIGFETALLLARKGYLVFATLRDLKKADPLRQAGQGLPLEVLRMDVDDPISVREAVRQTIRRVGHIDVLINNAGWGAFGAVSEFSDQEMSDQFETNVFGPARLTREIIPHMRRNGGGRIIYVGSLSGRMAFAGVGLYCASKHVIESLVESIRFELRPSGIEAAVVEPGHIRTSFKENRRQAKIYERGASAHQNALDGVLRFGNRPKGPGPHVVAVKILSVLQSPKLKIRYPAGWDAFWVPFASWFVPEPLYDVMTGWMYRLFFRPASARGASKPGTPVVLVTGATSGIGLATTLLLAKNGYKVWAGYRDPLKEKLMWKMLKGLKVTLVPLDVDRTVSVRKAVQILLRKERRLDAVVNNAGFVSAGFWEDMSDDDIRAQFQTNVFGVLRVCRETLPALRDSKGRIVNIGSTSAFGAYPLLGPYSATKSAIKAITETLRMEEKPLGVQITEINPGVVKTNIVNAAHMAEAYRKGTTAYPEIYKEYEALVKKGMTKAPSPDAVAEVVLSALNASKTKRRYFVNAGGRFSVFVRWLLPSIWCERIIGCFFKWSRFPKDSNLV